MAANRVETSNSITSVYYHDIPGTVNGLNCLISLRIAFGGGVIRSAHGSASGFSMALSIEKINAILRACIDSTPIPVEMPQLVLVNIARVVSVDTDSRLGITTLSSVEFLITDGLSLDQLVFDSERGIV